MWAIYDALFMVPLPLDTFESASFMTYFFRTILACLLVLTFFLMGCQAKNSDDTPATPVDTEHSSTVEADNIVEIMETAMSEARATSGPGAPALLQFSDDDTTVYLFGTVHLLKADLEWQTPAIEKVIADADKLVLEADTQSPEAIAKVQQVLLKEGVFLDGQTLSSVLGKDNAAIVEAAFEKNKIPMQAVEPLKPWMVSIHFGLTEMAKAGYDPKSGVEQVIISEIGDIDTEYLESAEEQIHLFSRAPYDEQVEGLLAVVSSSDIDGEYLDTLVSEWADGDLKGLTAMTAKPTFQGSEKTYDAFITNRNRNWVPKIKALLDEPGTKLVAVGAAHIVGDNSVVAMLKAEGIDVVRVE